MESEKKSSIQAIKKILDYDPISGHFRWKVGRGRVAAGDRAGTPHSGGYITIKVFGARHYAHRLAWAFQYGQIPDCEVDHVNGNKKDNRIINLRLASRAQNSMNAKLSSANRSGVKGVCWCSTTEKWRAFIRVDGVGRTLGHFDNMQDAIRVREEAADRAHDRFANYDNSDFCDVEGLDKSLK